MKIFFILLIGAGIFFGYSLLHESFNYSVDTSLQDATQQIENQYTSGKNKIDAVTQDATFSFYDFQRKIQETQDNITEKKAELDQKIKDIREAKAALDKVFGDSSEQDEKKIKDLQEKISVLEEEKQIVLNETQVLEDTAESLTKEESKGK